jgi:pimeloyl-ACP methyl ester carboxylesterase
MGAALALRLAVEAPEPVTALILARPAWGWDAAPDNMRPFAEAAPFLGQSDREGFAATATARRLAEEAPDNLASLLGFFERPERATLAELIRAIAADGPGVSEAAARRLRAPTLVLGCEVDRVHPLALAKMLAATIPRARFVELTPKARDPARHAAEFREAVAGFLAEALPPRAGEGRAPSPALRGRGPG